jgi:uncharacterized protein
MVAPADPAIRGVSRGSLRAGTARRAAGATREAAVGGLEALGIFAAGIGAGTINTIVGSGTLITFPTLIGFGYAPVVANTSNTLGLVPGGVSGAWGYRRELQGQGGRTLRFAGASVAGAATGAVLLLVLPASAFKAIVPVFIAIALVLVIVQPWLSRRLASRRHHGRPHGGWGLLAGVYACGVYGGYFGAAQGIILLAIFGVALDDDLQRLNGVKNVLTGLVNLVAAIVFLIIADLAWAAVGLIAVGSVIGGQVGATVGRRLPAVALRAVIVVVGIAAIVRLVTQ